MVAVALTQSPAQSTVTVHSHFSNCIEVAQVIKFCLAYCITHNAEQLGFWLLLFKNDNLQLAFYSFCIYLVMTECYQSL